jgi:hypothetical protein
MGAMEAMEAMEAVGVAVVNKVKSGRYVLVQFLRV